VPYTKGFKILFSQKLPLFWFYKSDEKIKFSAFLTACRLSAHSQGNYIDATKLVVCHNKRIFKHKVFKGLANRGKSPAGWFFGFKLHALINQRGQLVVFSSTSGNVADNNPTLALTIMAMIQGLEYVLELN
jgi:hypothetical protein